MNDLEKLKADVCKAIDARKDEIIEIGERIWKNPETGFREVKTSRLVSDAFKALGLPCREGLAVTGCRADLDSGRTGPTLALLGELDSIILSDHPEADPATGAVHSCGHHAQIANLLGAAIGLTSIDADKHISGKIAFVATPAEEFLEVAYRLDLVKQGKIRYCGGKAEMIRIGVFDDVNAAMIIHSASKYGYSDSYNGFVMKQVLFTGRAAHAALSPHGGVNALYAANLALNAINAQRETYKDEDCVRVHGIITRGGDAVNIIPDGVSLEIQVRAKTPAAVMDASDKVDRALRSGALAMGAAVDIETVPGYMPLRNCSSFAPYYFENIRRLDPDARPFAGGHRGSSTDVGDISQIMPAFHPCAGVCVGAAHTRDFRAADKEKAYVLPAKLLAMTALDLMHGDAAACRAIAAERPPLTKAEYLEIMEKAFVRKHYDGEA